MLLPMLGLLREASFRWLWIGRGASLLGMRLADLALPWLLLQATSSAWVTGAVLACDRLAAFVLSIPVGAWVDRGSKWKAALLAETLRFGATSAVAGLVLGGQAGAWEIALVLASLGAADVLHAAAFRPLVVHTVGRARLAAAFNLNEGADAVATLLGPLLAGTIIGRYGAGWALAADALTDLLAVASLLAARVAASGRQHREECPYSQPEAAALRDGRKRPGFGAWDGFRYLWRAPLARRLALAGCLLSTTSVAVGLWVVVLARDELHWDAERTGWIFSAMGAANVVAVLLLGGLVDRVAWSRLFTGAVALAGTGAAVLAGARSTLAVLMGAFLLDGALSAAFVLQSSRLTAVTPQDRMARVTVAAGLADDGVRALGRVLAGSVAEVGVRWALLGWGLVLAAASPWIRRWSVMSPLGHGVGHGRTPRIREP
ncbi:MFS transporter [Thermaerobacter sp. PB12/4term]|uniref:MFS transporter n=1 Tax=Thermaerobacter sp. PB12/4term TaxID=2293838 RepID=UPI000E3273B9